MSLEEQHPPETAPAPGPFQGQLLIATPVIGSGFFNRSLTYLCHHDANGAMGIVINQHLDLALSDMLEHLDIESISDLWERNRGLSCTAEIQNGRAVSPWAKISA